MATLNKYSQPYDSRATKVAYALGSALRSFHNPINWKSNGVFGTTGKVAGAVGALYYGFMPTIQQAVEIARPHLETYNVDAQLSTPIMAAVVGAGIAGAGAIAGKIAGNTVGYTAVGMTKLSVATTYACTWGLVKKGYNAFKKDFNDNRQFMKESAVQHIEEQIDMLDVALEMYKNDELMVASLNAVKSLTPQEFKDIQHNYRHLLEVRETSTLTNSTDVAIVFKEMSLGKVGQIFDVAGMKAVVTNETVQASIEEIPSLNEMVEMTLKQTSRNYFSELWAQVYHQHDASSFDDCMRNAAREVVNKHAGCSEVLSESVVKRVFSDAYRAAELSEPKLEEKIIKNLNEEVRKEEANMADAADMAGDPDFIAEQYEQAYIAKHGPI